MLSAMASTMRLGATLRTVVLLIFHDEDTNDYEKSDHQQHCYNTCDYYSVHIHGRSPV